MSTGAAARREATALLGPARNERARCLAAPRRRAGSPDASEASSSQKRENAGGEENGRWTSPEISSRPRRGTRSATLCQGGGTSERVSILVTSPANLGSSSHPRCDRGSHRSRSRARRARGGPDCEAGASPRARARRTSARGSGPIAPASSRSGAPSSADTGGPASANAVSPGERRAAPLATHSATLPAATSLSPDAGASSRGTATPRRSRATLSPTSPVRARSRSSASEGRAPSAARRTAATTSADRAGKPSPRTSSRPLLASPGRPQATSLPAEPERGDPEDDRRRNRPPGRDRWRREPGDVATPGPRPELPHSLGGESQAVGAEKGEEAREPDEEPGVLGIRKLFRQGSRLRCRTEDPGPAFAAAPGEDGKRGVEKTADLRRAGEHVGPGNHPRRPLRGHSLRPPFLAHSLSEGRRNLRTPSRADLSSGSSRLNGERRGPPSRPRSGDTTSRRPRACRACSPPGA